MFEGPFLGTKQPLFLCLWATAEAIVDHDDDQRRLKDKIWVEKQEQDLHRNFFEWKELITVNIRSHVSC